MNEEKRKRRRETERGEVARDDEEREMRGNQKRDNEVDLNHINLIPEQNLIELNPMIHNEINGHTYYLTTFNEWLNSNKPNLHNYFKGQYREIQETDEWKQQSLNPWIDKIQNGYVALSKPKQQTLPITPMIEAFKERTYHFDPQIIREEASKEDERREVKEKKKKKNKKKTSDMSFFETTIDPHELHDFDEVNPEKDRKLNEMMSLRILR
jgi:hypothetical protein